MKARRFLNVVMRNRDGGSMISRIVNPEKHLFYPSTAEAQQLAAANNTKEENESTSEKEVYDGVLRLPPPKIGFMPFTNPGASSGPGFLPFCDGTHGDESRILCVDHAGMTSLYDADAGTVQMMPALADIKGCRIDLSVCVTDAAGTPHSSSYPKDPDVLYVMDTITRSFEALAYGDPDKPMSLRHTGCESAWHWRRLPPPPVIVGRRYSNSVSCSYAVLHGHGAHGRDRDASSSAILASFSRPGYAIGTYCFDTGKGRWRWAGDWTLPFTSGALLHVPELGDHGLLFGLDREHFLAMDVFGGQKKKNRCAPVLRHRWVDVEVDPLADWRLQFYSVVYLGDGRFCIHRSFEVMETDGWGSGTECVDTVVLLTGVEVVRDGSGGLEMIKHKSRRVDSGIIYYVL